MTSEQEYNIKRKRQRVEELGNLLDMSSNVTLDKKKRMEVTQLQELMQFNMEKNHLEALEREIDIKIEHMEKIFEVFKGVKNETKVKSDVKV